MKCGTSDVVGARICIYPMQDNFVEIILNAVKASDKTGLAVITDDLGTTVQGREENVFSYVKEVFVRASKEGGHVAANVLFSAGCPGDVPEDFDFDVKVKEKKLPEEDKINTACAWSLYPLGDENYMDVICSEISDAVKSSKVEVESYHYCTRIDGSAKDVFDLLEDSFRRVRKRIRHTIIHATLSKGSPSKPKKKIQL